MIPDSWCHFMILTGGKIWWNCQEMLWWSYFLGWEEINIIHDSQFSEINPLLKRDTAKSMRHCWKQWTIIIAGRPQMRFALRLPKGLRRQKVAKSVPSEERRAKDALSCICLFRTEQKLAGMDKCRVTTSVQFLHHFMFWMVRICIKSCNYTIKKYTQEH